jgi:hypothetical protein
MQGNDSFRLVVRRGPEPMRVIELTQDVMSLGRDIGNDIVINDPEVSRQHLRFQRGVDGFTIADLGSTNGTFINSQRLVGSRPLNNGDTLGLGETVTLTYERVRPSQGQGSDAPTYAPGAAPGQYQPPQQNAYQPQQQRPQETPPPQQQQPYQAPYQAPGYAQQQPPAQQGQYGQGPQTPGQQQPYYPPNPQEYGAPGYAQQGGYPPQAPGQVPQAGYEYDPYAVREDEPRSAVRWIAIGCGVLAVFCACVSGLALVAVDTLNLWNTPPFTIVRDLLTTLGFGG